jgi:methionyl-tRNA synthetase
VKAKNKMIRKILLTTALPYANGPLHLGHVLENMLADFWTRYLKMKGHEVYFFCADDTHGTPIMLEAQKRGLKPEQLIAQVQAEHEKDFKGFLIEHTHYSSTNSAANQEICYYFYQHMIQKGLINKRYQEQLYCEHDKMFLPDRFVKGTCPKCHAPDQYGDSCDVCGATYFPKDLLSPKCGICGNPPVIKSSEQLFFRLDPFKDFLKKVLPKITDSSVAAKMSDWFKEDLRDWDISRNAPYFGFEIPGEMDKYFYVWLDAPMGYISSSKEYFDQSNDNDYLEFWQKESKSEVYHFIGKDITYFHTLFWPAILDTGNFRLPTQVFVHGFIKVNGQKMSKSRGTFILAKDYLKAFNPEYLRYYFASKLSVGQDDIDFNIEDFVSRTNGELIGKIVNLFSRTWSLLTKFNLTLQPLNTENLALFKGKPIKIVEKIAQAYEAREFHLAIHYIRELADFANRYFDQKAPWKLLKEDPEKAHQVLSLTASLARQLAVVLTPVLPNLSQKVAQMTGQTHFTWEDALNPMQIQCLKPYQNLLNRIDHEEAKKIMSIPDNKPSVPVRSNSTTSNDNPTKVTLVRDPNALKPEIELSDFEKIDLRVAEVLKAELVEGSDKLIRLQVSLGPLGERQVFAGIRAAYPNPQDLVGKKIVVIANLKPRKMKFGMSEGMSLAAGSGGSDLFLVSPLSGSKAGDMVK